MSKPKKQRLRKTNAMLLDFAWVYAKTRGPGNVDGIQIEGVCADDVPLYFPLAEAVRLRNWLDNILPR